MPIVWGVQEGTNVTYTPAEVQEIGLLSQPLPKNITKNGMC